MIEALKRPEVALGTLLLVASAFWHQRNVMAPTPVSRLDLLHAVVEDGTLAIDRHRNTCDLAFVNGHFYSDKAPGTAALALPFFAVSAVALSVVGTALDSPEGWLASSWSSTVATQSFPLALGGIALWSWLRRRVDPRVAMGNTVAILLGGMPLYYATALWSHTLVVGLLCMAIWAANVLGASPGRRRMVLAGACVGMALASEYTAGLVAAGLVTHVVLRRSPGLAWFVVAVAFPLLLVPAYSWATIGTPFDLPYSYQASFPDMREGLYAIKWPNLDIAGRLLFSPARGLFLWCPFLLIALCGNADVSKKERWLCVALPVVQLVAISGRAWDWQAGPSFGPRYLAPALPLIALPCALGAGVHPRLAAMLGVLSMALTALTVVTGPIISAETPDPLSFLLWDLRHMQLNPNLGTVFGLPPWLSLLAYSSLLASGCLWSLWAAGKTAGSEHSPWQRDYTGLQRQAPG